MQQRIAAKFGFSVDTNLSRWLCALLLVLSCLAGCAKQELSFEEQVRLRIRELEACVQRSELAELKEAVSLPRFGWGGG